VSAVDDLRATVLQGGDTSLVGRAVIELADRVAELQARVFPPPPLATDAVVIASQPIETLQPQLAGEHVEPPAPPEDFEAPEIV
jgi:hypothetical protein